MDVIEHPEIAAHQDQRGQDDAAGDQAKERGDIHCDLRRLRELPAVLDDGASHSEPRKSGPYVPAIKEA